MDGAKSIANPLYREVETIAEILSSGAVANPLYRGVDGAKSLAEILPKYCSANPLYRGVDGAESVGIMECGAVRVRA